MHMVTVTVVMLLIFQVKHFVADYLLQPRWMLYGKGDLRKPGGYAHAGVHALGSLPAFFVAGLSIAPDCGVRGRRIRNSLRHRLHQGAAFPWQQSGAEHARLLGHARRRPAHASVHLCRADVLSR